MPDERLARTRAEYGESAMMPTKTDLEALRENIIAQIPMKTRAADWHAVADAAMDLREIDATLAVLREMTIDPSFARDIAAIERIRTCDHEWTYDQSNDVDICTKCHFRTDRLQSTHQ